MLIRKHSQQLDSFIQRLTDEDDRALLHAAFEIAIENGGLLEQDFKREEGVNYNPRPARVVYILTKECGYTTSTQLAAAMIAVVSEADLDPADLPMPSEVQDLVRSARLPLAELASQSVEAIQIACAIQLDRARHFHLADPDSETFAQFISQTERYIPLAQVAAPRVSTLLRAWAKRAATKNQQAPRS